jgi:heme exporter protein B
VSGLVWAIVRRSARSGIAASALPVLFVLLVATLYPFAIGPDAALLARTGGGVLWVAALLAALLPIERLVADDARNGVLDQYAVRGLSDEGVAAATLAGHWLAFAPAVMLACLPAAALLRLAPGTLWRLEAGLALGTPALAALGLLTAGLTAGLPRASALGALLMLPLAIPVLIFGAGALDPAIGGALKLLAATSLALVGIAPFAAGAALRALRD